MKHLVQPRYDFEENREKKRGNHTIFGPVQMLGGLPYKLPYKVPVKLPSLDKRSDNELGIWRNSNFSETLDQNKQPKHRRRTSHPGFAFCDLRRCGSHLRAWNGQKRHIPSTRSVPARSEKTHAGANTQRRAAGSCCCPSAIYDSVTRDNYGLLGMTA